MKIRLKKLLSKTAIILVIALTCSFFTACKVESVAEHDKRVAKEAEELEKQVKDITKNNTDNSDSTEATTITGSESTDNAQADNAGNQDAGNTGSYDNAGSSDDSGAASQSGGSSEPSNTPVAAVVTVNVKTRDAGFLVNGATVTVEDNTNVFNLMKQAQNNGILTIDYRTTAYGKYISAINGIYETGSQAGWKFQVNGVDSSVGVSSARVHNGDVVTWYYVNSATETLDY